MKRFYKAAEAGTAPGGHVVRLDGKVLKTPLRHPLILASAALAAAIAEEWAAQGDEVVPSSMPLTQLANTMADKGGGADRVEMERTVAGYGASDLVCYFAAHPRDLVARQEKHWRPLVEWLARAHGIALETVQGIQYRQQSPDSLKKIEKIISALDAAGFTVLQAAAGMAGSFVIGLALAQSHIGAEEAWRAALVDEIYQLEKWGEDALARKRLDNLRAEMGAVARFRDLVRASSSGS
jgi:chaperone required for assembly of F1-ATPase